MKTYRDINTGEVWTEDEIRKAFEAFRYEMKETYDSFEEYMDEMLRLGRDKVGGLVEGE